MRTVNKALLLALGFGALGTVAGCGERNTPSETNSDAVGSASFEVRLGDGRAIDSARYTITGPKDFSKTGSINVSASNTLSATIPGLPAGGGYEIQVTAKTREGSVDCSGVAKFDVIARKTVNVVLALSCHEAPRLGSVSITGTLNLCPTIDGIGADPAEVQVEATIALSSLAHDSDAGPKPLTYAWRATSGTFSDPAAPNPTFTCTKPGPVTLTLSVSDGDPETSCADQLSTQITCSAGAKAPGSYAAGDFHNHSTCSDGAISMQKLVQKATGSGDGSWGLDWFVQAGHGGNGNRNCTLVEDATLDTPAYPYVSSKSPTTSWEDSGISPKGDSSGTSPKRNMWRWQSVQEFQYPLIEYLNAYKNLPLFLGLETVVPGHEHTSMSVITGQIPTGLDSTKLPTTPGYTALGNANALANWEYCFDRGDADKSRGAENAWDCSVPGSANESDASWNVNAKKLLPAGGVGSGTRGHAKTLESLKWLAAYHPNTSYY
ncbi:MAG TPA: hypothetical protein VFQ61_14015, partial [Polyangiaceae bacterium]|nr:hypothetical protein [Polyangiaceae bacterium]